MKRKEANKKIRKMMGSLEKLSRKNKLFFPLIFLEDQLLKLYRKNNEFRAILVLNNKGTYFFMRKVATTTLTKIFEKYETYRGSQLPKNYEEYFKFTFVRNPYDRVVSCWKNKVCDREGDNTVRLKHGIDKNTPFKEFVKVIHGIPDIRADRHILPQHKFLVDKKGKLIPDFIGKFENLEKDYKYVMKKLGVKNPPRLPRENKSKRKKSYRSYYDEETRRLVYERYKKDFELFGYNKEL